MQGLQGCTKEGRGAKVNEQANARLTTLQEQSVAKLLREQGSPFGRVIAQKIERGEVGLFETEPQLVPAGNLEGRHD